MSEINLELVKRLDGVIPSNTADERGWVTYLAKTEGGRTVAVVVNVN